MVLFWVPLNFKSNKNYPARFAKHINGRFTYITSISCIYNGAEGVIDALYGLQGCNVKRALFNINCNFDIKSVFGILG